MTNIWVVEFDNESTWYFQHEVAARAYYNEQVKKEPAAFKYLWSIYQVEVNTSDGTIL